VLSRTADAEVRGAQLSEAGTLSEAREALDAELPNLVILDVRLPDGSGLDLARELMGRGHHRPSVLILSASVLTGDRNAAVAAGCDAFLGKPFRPAEMVELVHTLLEANRARESA
jgi:DNA-binding response OmpR family regulator